MTTNDRTVQDGSPKGYSRREVLGVAAGVGLYVALGEPFKRIVDTIFPSRNKGTMINKERAPSSFRGALDHRDIADLRRLIPSPEDEVSIVDSMRRYVERSGSKDPKSFTWNTEMLNFNMTYLAIMARFSHSLLGEPSEELVKWSSSRSSLGIDDIPIFPYVQLSSEPAFGYAVIPTEPYLVTNPPKIPYGIYVEYGKRDPSPLDTIMHEFLHWYIGPHNTTELERKGYTQHAHDFVDDIVRAIRGEAFGYHWRDNRGILGTEAQRQVIAVDAQDTTSTYAHPDARLTPLLHAYKNGKTGIFRDIVGSIQ